MSLALLGIDLASLYLFFIKLYHNILFPSSRRAITASTTAQRPIPNSYWASPTVLACEYPWAPSSPAKLDALLKAGVRTLIDLTEPDELSPYAPHLATRTALLGIDPSSVEYHRFPIRDRALPDSVDCVYRVLRVLHDNERRGRICAVHCRGGIGRTGLVIGCWLVDSGVVGSGDEALGTIAKEWKTVEKCVRFPHSPETGAQFEYVQRFRPEKGLRKSGSLSFRATTTIHNF
jgi:hypothetical protein